MRKISGKIISRGNKWFTVLIDGYDKNLNNYLLICYQTKHYRVNQRFVLWVETEKKQYGQTVKWFHLPANKSNNIVIGFGLDTHILQPITGNVFVKGDKAYVIISVKKRTDGWSYGYTSEYWWECTCQDITKTQRGQKALEELI